MAESPPLARREQEAVAEHPHTPVPKPMHAGQLLSISGFWLATNVLWTALLAILINHEAAEMLGPRQSLGTGFVIGGGAILALVVPLLAGPLSDRCASRFGRRRPYMFAGVAVNVIGLAMMMYFGLRQHFWAFFIGYLVVQIGNNLATGAYQGVIPDLVVPAQRGAASGYMGMMSQLGSAIGIIVVAVVFKADLVKSYIFLIVVLIGCLLWTAAAMDEQPLRQEPPPFRLTEFLKGLWIDPREYPDFAWVWITRALVMFGFYTVQPFVSYYLRDVIGVPPDQLQMTQGKVFILILVGATISGIYGGWLSDRIGRKGIVYVANGIMAVAAVALVFCRNLNEALAVGIVFGLGYGAYISVDWALGTDVLPNQEEAGKDMAVWHIAMVAPQSLAAPIAGFLLAIFGSTQEGVGSNAVTHYHQAGYLTAFGVAALALALGAFLLRNVKKAR